MVLDFVYPSPLCSQEDSRPAVVKDVHYLYFSTMLSFLTLVLVVSISLATEKPRPEQVSATNQTATDTLVTYHSSSTLTEIKKRPSLYKMAMTKLNFILCMPN